ncbi:hypothetical protein [Streptomyces tanashiensis]|uniref:Uncharacterized protein n=1 Tax=Streptomyces tanashiensis TaxID=67367 RepID=A0ABY6QPR2_9ACTN|nr:hypothetical protein [Streptomyces tanashiensis]UZX19800.1 hypothetical protein LDH80_03225 [Streptomyces tanashiensis]GGY41680.1 hypothetical protein GCM10010299_54880 [Streptomyces tanashiensis]
MNADLSVAEPLLLDAVLPDFGFCRLECAVMADGGGYQGDPEAAQPWVALGERAGREIVFGAAGKVGRPTIEWRRVEPRDHADSDEPGWATTTAAFVVHPYGARRSLLTYEARTACTDPDSTTRFGRCWTLVSPGRRHRAAPGTADDREGRRSRRTKHLRR